MSLIILYVVFGAAGLFIVDKGVETYKHNATLSADRYASCVKYAETVRECRGLE